MVIIFIIICVLSLLTGGLFSSTIKGVIGEQKISSLLYFLDKSKYTVMNNIVLQTGGKTTQIDHLVISGYGIFVIETKNYKGWILGNEHSEYWTQVLFKRKERFYNPIRQNLGHIKALKSCLHEYPNIPYQSVIVFSSKADLKVTTHTDVVYWYELPGTIKKYHGANLTEKDKEDIFRKINASNTIDTYNKRDHIRSIKQNIQKSEASVREGICPRCGGVLTMRNGKYGKFLGCSSFPGCKFTRNI
jgi:hypothetical protein